MQTKIFNQIERRKKKKINNLFALSFFLFSSLISFSLIGCGGGGGGGGGGYLSASKGPIIPALFSGWEMTNGPFSGLVYSLAVDPNNSQKVSAAVGSGGLFTSYDGGMSWTHVEGDLANLLILAVAVGGDGQTIYVGTRGDGIYKSTNGGGNWDPINSGLPDRFFEIDDLIIDSMDTGTVYAILDTRFHLYRTINGGDSWEEIGEGLPIDQIRSFAIHPIDTQLLYAGTYQNGIFTSEDGGLTWTPINGNFPPYIVHFSCIGIDPGNPIDPDDDIIYAGTHDYGLYKTEDNGDTWQFIPLGDLTVAYNFHIDALALDPVDQSILYAYVENVSLVGVPDPTKEGIYRSFNGGVEWERIPFLQYPDTYRPISEIILAPNNGNVAYVTTQGEGLFMTNDIMSVDDVNDWEAIDNGLVDLSVYAMLLHSWNNEEICAGTSRGFFKTTDGGLTWERKGLVGKIVSALATSDPGNMNIIYAATDTGVYKTTDGGDTWSEPSKNQFNCLAIGTGPGNSNIIYGGNSFGLGVYKAVDDGSTPWEDIIWEEINNGLSNDEKWVLSLAIDPSDASILYAGTGYRRMPGPETSGKVIKTTDGGNTWPEEQKWSLGEPVNSLSMDHNTQILYAGTYVGLYASSDGGEHWQFKGIDVGIDSIGIDHMDSMKICAGTYDNGVFASIDGGENWVQIDQGLTCDLHKRICSLAMDVSDIENPVVYAGTGCGVFKAHK